MTSAGPSSSGRPVPLGSTYERQPGAENHGHLRVRTARAEHGLDGGPDGAGGDGDTLGLYARMEQYAPPWPPSDKDEGGWKTDASHECGMG